MDRQTDGMNTELGLYLHAAYAISDRAMWLNSNNDKEVVDEFDDMINVLLYFCSSKAIMKNLLCIMQGCQVIVEIPKVAQLAVTSVDYYG